MAPDTRTVTKAVVVDHEWHWIMFDEREDTNRQQECHPNRPLLSPWVACCCRKNEYAGRTHIGRKRKESHGGQHTECSSIVQTHAFNHFWFDRKWQHDRYCSRFILISINVDGSFRPQLWRRETTVLTTLALQFSISHGYVICWPPRLFLQCRGWNEERGMIWYMRVRHTQHVT